MNVKALVAEVVGTFWLVLGGCGAAVIAADFGASDNGTSLGLGFLGVSFAFGLSVVTGIYALGHISGGHFNPAVTLGLVAGGRFAPSSAAAYVGAQLLGAIIAAVVIFGIANGQPGFEIDSEVAGTFASNGYGDFSPGGYGVGAAFLAEAVLTAVFVVVIMGSTSKKAAPAMGGLAIGLTLTLIHMVSIPVTNTGVNPARSTSQALFAGTNQLEQLWLFWVAPILGGVVGALFHRYVVGDPEDLLEAEDLAQGDETLR